MPDHIFDTTVLSNLAAVGRLDLLEKRYGKVGVTTVEVSDELRRGFQAGYGYLENVLQQIQSISPGGWLRIVAPQSLAEHQLRGEFDLLLDPGEASCLALALSRGLILVRRSGSTPSGSGKGCAFDGDCRHLARSGSRWSSVSDRGECPAGTDD
jgi:hypothetical protein